ncbi:MAG: hypothetical protein HQL56_14465 [Magnetococcales bacterium]|nr:hypothetical protein [Magnetococcales bacterium]
MSRNTSRNMLPAIREALLREGAITCYQGYLTEELLHALAQTLRTALALEESPANESRTLFTLFVEQAQNIVRYSAASLSGCIDGELHELRQGMLLFGRREGRPYLACGNAVARPDAARLEASLARLHSLDAPALKMLHKQILKEGPPPGSKGAGVGFIDIARLASGGFDFQFLDMDENHVFFVLTACF